MWSVANGGFASAAKWRNRPLIRTQSARIFMGKSQPMAVLQFHREMETSLGLLELFKLLRLMTNLAVINCR